jgi:hypothetical protein
MVLRLRSETIVVFSTIVDDFINYFFGDFDYIVTLIGLTSPFGNQGGELFLIFILNDMQQLFISHLELLILT